MTYSGENIAEHMVPSADEVVDRIHGFYEVLGWTVLSAEENRLLSAVPGAGPGIKPIDGIGYYRTETESKTVWFEDIRDPEDPHDLSVYTRGLRLPRRMDLIERPLILPSNDDLRELVEMGGELLRSHTHVNLRRHADRLEFRFADPFLYGIRITGPKLKPIIPMSGPETRETVQVPPFETLTGRDQFIVKEHFMAFRNNFAPEVSPAIAQRAFGLLVPPGPWQTKGRFADPAKLRLVVVTRDQVGLPAPANAQLTKTEAVEIGSLLDFAITMDSVSLYGLNRNTKDFIARVARQLAKQIELAQQVSDTTRS